METVAPLGRGRALPDLSVVEFAIMMVLLRLGPQPAPALLPTLSDWFGYALSLRDIRSALRRLEHQGYVMRLDDGALRPRGASAKPVSQSLTALIRIIGTEFCRVLRMADPPLLEHILKKSAENEAVAAAAALRQRQGKAAMTDTQREAIRERVRREARNERLWVAKAKAEAEVLARAGRKSQRKGKRPVGPANPGKE